MTEEQSWNTSEQEEQDQKPQEETGTEEDPVEKLQKELNEANDKYIRLYADFENYKKISAKNKEEMLKYANEDLMSEILTVIDHLELALQHASESEASDSLAEGVKLTLKELTTVLEKHGLTRIETVGRAFDPVLHHAMSQVETDEAEENTVVQEFRKGYMLKDRVLRAPLVGVAKRPGKKESEEDAESGNNNNNET